MSEKEYQEKDEKEFNEKEEKEVLKHDEKVEQQDQLSSITWAFILIWAGVVFLTINMGWVDRLIKSAFITRFLPDNMIIFEPAIWSIIMLGAGVIILMEVVVRILLPQFRRHVGGSLIVAFVFIAIGLFNIFGWEWDLLWRYMWPAVLIIAGIGVLIGGFGRRRK